MGEHWGMSVWARVLVGLAALALLASACGDDGEETVTTDPPDTEPSSTEPSSTEPSSTEPGTSEPATTEPADEPLTASNRGVTADTIHVGVALLDMDWLRDNGFSAAGWGDQEAVWNALFDDINDRGGINGRMIEPVLEFYNPIGTAAAEELCVVFTEDNELFAVLGGFLGPAEPAMECLLQEEELLVVGGTMTDELLARSDATWFVDGRTKNRTIPAMLDLLDGEGRLDDRRIFVVSGDENAADYDAILKPALEARDANIVDDAVNDVVGTDIPAEDAIWLTIAERIRQADAEVVIINGDTTAAIRGISRNGLDVERWAIDPGQLGNLGDSVERSEGDGTITIQGTTAMEGWENETMVACRQTVLDALPDPSVVRPSWELTETDEQWPNAIGQACRNVMLFETLALAGGRTLTPQSVAEGAVGIGEFAMPGFPYASLGPDKNDVNDSARLVEWDSTAGEGGQMVAVTELIDLAP